MILVGIGQMETIGLMRTGKRPMERQGLHLAVPSLSPGKDESCESNIMPSNTIYNEE